MNPYGGMPAWCQFGILHSEKPLELTRVSPSARLPLDSVVNRTEFCSPGIPHKRFSALPETNFGLLAGII
jgi:hypothetical protein